MELRQLLYFVEVAKREHVSEAADALHVAQSAISRQIANLETELGVQLLQRRDQRLGDEPAPEGIEVTAHVGEIRELHRYS